MVKSFIHQDGSLGEEQVWEQENEFSFAYKTWKEHWKKPSGLESFSKAPFKAQLGGRGWIQVCDHTSSWELIVKFLGTLQGSS